MAAACGRGRTGLAGATLLVQALFLLWSCSADVVVTLVKPPPAAPAQLIVGDIAAEDPEARRLARFMRTALLKRLLRAEAFAVVYDRTGRNAGKDALLVQGTVTEADPGSEALRFIIGSGLGRPHLAASFRLLDEQGTVQAAFAVASDDPGPTGLTGHWQALSTEDLAQDLGRAAADAIVRWTEGEDLAAGAMF